ncbi:nitroreductase family protein [Eubacteriaceae bacterium ES3]|nr:nitroreductase family protein [Eubacteriaceae bacterium ES3]
METKQLFRVRKSVRDYTGKLSEEALQSVLDAAQLSPVGRGDFKSMHLTVIRNKSLLADIEKNAGEFFDDTSRQILYGAPCLILVSTILGDVKTINVPYSNAAIMANNMALAAIDSNIGSCLIWGAVMAMIYNPDLLKKLELPEGFLPCCGVVLGETDENFKERTVPLNRIAVEYI